MAATHPYLVQRCRPTKNGNMRVYCTAHHHSLARTHAERDVEVLVPVPRCSPGEDFVKHYAERESVGSFAVTPSAQHRTTQRSDMRHIEPAMNAGRYIFWKMNLQKHEGVRWYGGLHDRAVWTLAGRSWRRIWGKCESCVHSFVRRMVKVVSISYTRWISRLKESCVLQKSRSKEA